MKPGTTVLPSRSRTRVCGRAAVFSAQLAKATFPFSFAGHEYAFPENDDASAGGDLSGVLGVRPLLFVPLPPMMTIG
jgi:hypothetical protein